MAAESAANAVVVTLEPSAPAELAERLENVPGVRVVRGAPESAIVASGDIRPLAETVVLGPDELEPWLASLNEGARLALIKAVLDDETAARLEDAGVGYVDAALRAWLPGRTRTARSRTGRGASRRLRVESLRLAQLIADHPSEHWTERGLADRGGSSSVTAHRLLARLEREGLLDRPSNGRTRRVREAAAIRRWLARHGRPGRTNRLACFLPDANAPKQSAEVALTGAGAAAVLGMPVLTTVRRPTYRVAADGEEFERVPEALGGFRTERGANAVLIADPHRLAFTDVCTDAEGRRRAPPSRVMLDLFLEPRGEAAAEVFLDLWGAKEIE